jgi:hypothetical protein
MEVSHERVEKIQGFARNRQKAEGFYDQQQISSSDIQAYERKLDDTLRELQDRVKRQEEDIRSVCCCKPVTMANPTYQLQLTSDTASGGQCQRYI